MLAPPACSPGPPAPVEVFASESHLGTFVEITVLGPDRAGIERAIGAAYAEVARIEALMSPKAPDSDLSRVNAAAGRGPLPVSAEFLAVVARALEVSEKSGGAFDISFAGLGRIWSFDPEAPRKASAAEIAERLGLINWRDIVVDPQAGAVGLSREGMAIGLGAIAKGYAVDRAIAALEQNGVTMAMVNAGGDLRVIGRHQDRPWTIGLQHPRQPDALIARLKIADAAIATSGDYEKCFVQDGVRYHHLLDPKTGMPASGAASVTVLAPDATTADAYATAVFVLGPKPGMDLVENTPGLEAVIIGISGDQTVSKGLKDTVEWIEPEGAR